MRTAVAVRDPSRTRSNNPAEQLVEPSARVPGTGAPTAAACLIGTLAQRSRARLGSQRGAPSLRFDRSYPCSDERPPLDRVIDTRSARCCVPREDAQTSPGATLLESVRTIHRLSRLGPR